MNECDNIRTTFPLESRRVNDNKATESNALYLHSARYLHTTRGRLVIIHTVRLEWDCSDVRRSVYRRTNLSLILTFIYIYTRAYNTK